MTINRFFKITIFFIGVQCLYSYDKIEYTEESAREYLIKVLHKHDAGDVSEVLCDCKPNLEEYIKYNSPVFFQYFSSKLNAFSRQTSLTLEEFLDQKKATIPVIEQSINIDVIWETEFQNAAVSNLLLPPEYKNPTVVKKYLDFLREIDPTFKAYCAQKLSLYLPASDTHTMSIHELYRAYEAIRDYYRADGTPLSVLLTIKVAEEKQKKAASWHVSDLLPWPFFMPRSKAGWSSVSSDDVTPSQSSSDGSRESTPPKDDDAQQNIRKRRITSGMSHTNQ
ncbi:MAG: hypothetical protein Q8K36_07030 [Alphaproteobacteria bacterium]|nr:hypothetical protein [Alphaproteobacteria bacterium]